MKTARNIVLVDDDPDDHEIFQIAILQAAPATRCFFYHSGREALEMLVPGANPHPDYIFIDLNMPGMHGLQLLEELGKKALQPGIPIFIYSTSILPQERKKAIELGASRFFIKPASHFELIQLISEIFREYES
jgi:CheY-like chemotaxis protein